METLLAEVMPMTERAITVGSLAGLLAVWEGVKVGKRRWNGRNGNGDSKPGHTVACVDHLTRLGVLEAEVKHVRKELARVEKSLDSGLLALKESLDKVLEKR